MHGTVGLKLASLCSDLTWKKVSKGNRSRRARSSITRILGSGEELISKDCNTLDMPVSESEKLGVSVLGCHFNEKAEHVPIKKRKFMFRSPSPPPRAPSQHLVETESHLKSQPEASDCAASASDLGQIVDNNLVRVEKQVNKSEDLSGISILAASACNGHAEEVYRVEGSFTHDAPSSSNELGSLTEQLLKEDLGSADISSERTSCISVLPAEEVAASLRTDNFLNNSVPQEDTEQDNSLQNPSMAAVADPLTEKDQGTERVLEFSSRDDRLHWDLNTSMDAWERPYDCPGVDSEINVEDDTSEDVKHCEHSDKMGHSEVDTVERDPADGYHDEKELIPAGSGELQEQQLLISEELNLDSCAYTASTSSFTEGLSSSSRYNAANTVSAYTDGDENALNQFLTLGSTGNIERLSSDQVAGLDISVANNLPSAGTIIAEAICHDASAGVTCMDNKDGHAGGTSEIILTSLQVEKEQVSLPVTLPGEATCETQDVLIEDSETANKISDLHDDVNTSKNNMAREVGSDEDGRENYCCQSDEAVMLVSSAVGLEMPDLAASAVELNVQHNVPGPDTTGTAEMEQNECEELLTQSSEKCIASLDALSGFSACDRRTNNSEDLVNNCNKKALDEPLNNGNSSDISHADRVNAKARRFEVDYDSQYEDGEVRESIEHAWEDYEGEDMEAEHIDYGCENVNLGSASEENVKQAQGTDFQPSPSCSRGIESNEIETSDNICTEPKAGPKEVDGDSGNGAGMDEMKTGARNESSKKNVLGDCVTRLDVEDQTTMVESRAFRRELRSQIEGRMYHDVSFRSDAPDSTPGSERDPDYVESFGRGRFVQHIHARDRENDHWFDSRDGSRYIKRHYSPNFHGSMSSCRPVSENVVHQRLTRDGSHDAGDEPFGMRMRIRPSRDLSPGRRVSLDRGRSMRCGLTVDGRGPPRLRYHGPVPDRSFSPIERARNLHVPQSHSNSPSRSRSRSPSCGNQSFRQRSQSPKFRSELRIKRVRSPQQGPSLLADRVGGFRPIPRNHGSPPCSTRWIGDRKDGVVHFREQGFSPRSSFIGRRSPGGLGRRDDRFDMIASPRNFRHMHSGRFTDMDGVARGVVRYQGRDDDRGKHGYRYRLVHPAKRYDMDGSAKRFRYNAEDGFMAARNSRYRDATDYHGSGSPKDNGKGIENRIGDVPRKFREDRAPFVYRREENYDVDAKSIVIREGDDDVASRRRPS